MANKSLCPYTLILIDLIPLSKTAIWEIGLHGTFFCTYRSTVWSLNWSRTGSLISIQCHNFFWIVCLVQQWRCYILWWFSTTRFSGKIIRTMGKRSVQKGLKKQVRRHRSSFIYYGLSKAPDGRSLLQNCFSIQIHKYSINIQQVHKYSNIPVFWTERCYLPTIIGKNGALPLLFSSSKTAHSSARHIRCPWNEEFNKVLNWIV